MRNQIEATMLTSWDGSVWRHPYLGSYSCTGGPRTTIAIARPCCIPRATRDGRPLSRYHARHPLDMTTDYVSSRYTHNHRHKLRHPLHISLRQR